MTLFSVESSTSKSTSQTKSNFNCCTGAEIFNLDKGLNVFVFTSKNTRVTSMLSKHGFSTVRLYKFHVNTIVRSFTKKKKNCLCSRYFRDLFDTVDHALVTFSVSRSTQFVFYNYYFIFFYFFIRIQLVNGQLNGSIRTALGGYKANIS